MRVGICNDTFRIVNFLGSRTSKSALSGIGIVTAGMMARITLGHTGRNIQQHSRLLAPIFMSLIAAYVARVLLPMIAPAHYLLWLGMAQAAWLIAFALFVWVYPILVKPRADGAWLAINYVLYCCDASYVVFHSIANSGRRVRTSRPNTISST